MTTKKICLAIPVDEHDVMRKALMEYIKENNKVISLQEFIRIIVMKELKK